MSGLDNPNLGCPLCISYLQHAITTTCGHSFCGKNYLFIKNIHIYFNLLIK